MGGFAWGVGTFGRIWGYVPRLGRFVQFTTPAQHASTPTTFHLHFELLQNTADSGWVHVPPYTSLVAAYERRESGIGEEIVPNVAVAAATTPALEGPDAPVITEAFVMPDPELVTDPE